MTARSSRTLRPEDEIARYRIVGPLGAGGMGEVYLAQDTALGRNVALKVLPPELVRSEERVRRFVLEAKSASSLSHPNIVTIHEIGQEAVRSPGGGEGAPVHYISMELVSGKTLSAHIHDEQTELRTLLGWLAQAADGIAKAHAAGIVHRDLKPGNIMVTTDGFAKVLDFGLAKLTESRASDPEVTHEPTVARDATGEGTVVGTAGYMSPEQVQGRSVDHRSDVFSFGCILYEAATRRRAFAAESSIETMHKVLHEAPAPVEELNPKAPSDLRRLIRRCLQKNPDQRLQSMKDLALELREIEAEFEALSASASSGSRAGAAPAAARRAPVLPWAVAGAAVLVAAAALAWWGLRRGEPRPSAFQSMRMATQTTSGDIAAAALSADGRFLAYVGSKAGRHRLVVRQVATGSDVTIVPPGEAQVSFPAFSPDGNYLYYCAPLADRPNYRALFQVPSLGGTPREIAFDVDSRLSFAPDGKQAVFRRHSMDPAEDRLVVIDLASRQERVLAKVSGPVAISAAPAWSPDGKQVAAVVNEPGASLRTVIALFDARDGRRRDWVRLERAGVSSIAWLRGGSGLVTSGLDVRRVVGQQIDLRPYPAGRPSPLTNDLNNYTELSASLADETVAALRTARVANLVLVDASGAGSRRLTSATSSETSLQGIAVADSATVLSTAPRDGVLQLWAVPLGEAPRLLTDMAEHSFNALAAPGLVVHDHFDSSGIHVWAMAPDGGSRRQLTRGEGEQAQLLSPDGRFVVVAPFDAAQKFVVIATADGRPQLELENVTGLGPFSPDSRSLVVLRPRRDARGLTVSRPEIVPLDGGPVRADTGLPAEAFAIQWTPDGTALTYHDRTDPGWNVRRQPLAGGPATAVTRFTGARVLRHRWSPDGRRLAALVRRDEATELWVTGADGANPVQVTRLSPEAFGAFAWLPDGRRLVVEAVTVSSDVVLIRDIR